MKAVYVLSALLVCWLVFVADIVNDAATTAFFAVAAIVIALCCILVYLSRHED